MTLLAKYIPVMLLIGLSLFSACKSFETTPPDQVSLSVNKSARVGADITVRVDSLKEGRCPTNVICIWGGQASVYLSLSKGTRTEKRRLIIPSPTKDRIDSTTVQFDNKQYKVILQAVNPYPREITDLVETATRQATILVTKL